MMQHQRNSRGGVWQADHAMVIQPLIELMRDSRHTSDPKIAGYSRNCVLSIRQAIRGPPLEWVRSRNVGHGPGTIIAVKARVASLGVMQHNGHRGHPVGCADFDNLR